VRRFIRLTPSFLRHPQAQSPVRATPRSLDEVLRESVEIKT